MNKFFTELAAGMEDKQILTLRITKVGEELTILSLTKGKKDVIVTGSPEEVDQNLAGDILSAPAKTGYTVKVVDNDPDNEEEEEGEDSKADRDNKKADSGKAKTSKGGKKEVAKTSTKKTAEKGKAVKAEEENEVLLTAENDVIEEPKVSEPAKVVKAEPKDDSARIDNEFKALIHEGKKVFEDKSKGSERYQAAVDIFEKALLLKPGNEEAMAESNKAYKWVKMVAEL